MKNNLPIYDLAHFLPASDEHGFYASQIASHLEQYKFVTLPHKHSFYMALICVKGRGTHMIDFNTYEIKPGSLFFMVPGQTHYWKATEPIEGYVFFHSREFYDLNYVNKRINDYPFYYCSYNSSVLYLKPNELTHLEQFFLEMLKEFKGDELGKYQKICSLVDLMYIDASRMYVGERQVKMTNRYSTKIRQLEELIDKHVRKIKSPVEYAEMMHVSSKQLNRICKATVGKTTSVLIAEKLVLEAKRLLVYGELNVNEVAAELGFEDTAYFARLFKKYSKQTPIEFVKMYRKKLFGPE